MTITIIQQYRNTIISQLGYVRLKRIHLIETEDMIKYSHFKPSFNYSISNIL